MKQVFVRAKFDSEMFMELYPGSGAESDTATTLTAQLTRSIYCLKQDGSPHFSPNCRWRVGAGLGGECGHVSRRR